MAGAGLRGAEPRKGVAAGPRRDVGRGQGGAAGRSAKGERLLHSFAAASCKKRVLLRRTFPNEFSSQITRGRHRVTGARGETGAYYFAPGGAAHYQNNKTDIK